LRAIKQADDDSPSIRLQALCSHCTTAGLIPKEIELVTIVHRIDATSAEGSSVVTAPRGPKMTRSFSQHLWCVALVLILAPGVLSGCRSAPPRLTGEPDQGGSAVVQVESADSFEGKVVAVADGDTITVLHGRESIKVRLYGVDAPESGDAFSNVSKRLTSDLVFGQTVRVEGVDHDRYGRLVAKVSLADGRSLSQELVRNGCAWWFRKYAPADRELERLEAEARQSRVGLWADPNPIPPWDSRAQKRGGAIAGASPETRGLADIPAEGAPVIGNRRSMVYHLPECPDYAKVSEKNRVPFASPADAEAAGYRKSGNCP
jgi:endonuclease YncB( thermonuclease family)